MKETNIRQAREHRNWSQSELAGKIGTTNVNISRWEHGKTFPSSYYRQRLCGIFDMETEELFPEPIPTPPLHLVPENAASTDGTPDFSQAISAVVQTLQSSKSKGYEGQIQFINGQSEINEQISVEMRLIELERQKLQIVKEQREELEKELHLIEKLIDLLDPGADQATKANLLQTWISQLLGNEARNMSSVTMLRKKRLGGQKK